MPGVGRRKRNPKPRKKHPGRSLLVLAAAIAVPAMAAPEEWRAFALPEITTVEEANVELMGFEKSGESFPGSAFYYLADEPYLTQAELAAAEEDALPIWGDIFSDADPAATPDNPVNFGQVGAAASPLVTALGTTSGSRALRCLTQAIYYEARSEPDAGQRAVAQVVLNRVKHKSYPNTVCGVVFQGSNRRTGCQFSFTCDGSMRKTPAATWWNRSERVARSALAGAVYRPVGLATHYHTVQIYPYWAPSLVRVGTIGAHHFYRFGNAAGQPGAFRNAYRGNEPGTPTAARQAAATDVEVAGVADPLDPLAIQKAYDEAFKRAQAQSEATGGTVGGIGAGFGSGGATSTPAATAPAGAPRGSAGTPRSANSSPNLAPRPSRGAPASQQQPEKLPQSGTVKEEYANSGTWIERPSDVTQ